MQVNPLAPEYSGGSKGKEGPLAPHATSVYLLNKIHTSPNQGRWR